jgi:transcriptional regulator with XRE-family HTH domain
MMNYRFNAGKSLSNLMLAGGDTPSSLANKLGTTRQQVFRWRRSTDIKVSVMLDICDIYQITPGKFVELGEYDAEVDH